MSLELIGFLIYPLTQRRHTRTRPFDSPTSNSSILVKTEQSWVHWNQTHLNLYQGHSEILTTETCWSLKNMNILSKEIKSQFLCSWPNVRDLDGLAMGLIWKPTQLKRTRPWFFLQSIWIEKLTMASLDQMVHLRSATSCNGFLFSKTAKEI